MKSTPEQLAFVALGSNQGDSRRNVSLAIELLRNLSREPLLVSSLWESDPVDCPPGSPPFINAVVGLSPLAGETPESLLAKLQATEKQFGRQPKVVMNEPRPLDLDLVTFRAESRSSPQLILPHPRARLRRFVLAPLSEIAPGLRLPGCDRTVHELLEHLPQTPSVRTAQPPPG